MSKPWSVTLQESVQRNVANLREQLDRQIMREMGNTMDKTFEGLPDPRRAYVFPLPQQATFVKDYNSLPVASEFKTETVYFEPVILDYEGQKFWRVRGEDRYYSITDRKLITGQELAEKKEYIMRRKDALRYMQTQLYTDPYQLKPNKKIKKSISKQSYYGSIQFMKSVYNQTATTTQTSVAKIHYDEKPDSPLSWLDRRIEEITSIVAL